MNKIIYFFMLLINISVQGQMFNYSTKQNNQNKVKVETDKYTEMTDIINKGFNYFEDNLRALSLWEVHQYKRVILEIEKETKGMPQKRKDEYKNKKILELSFLLNEKEMEMQYQYIELLDYFNDKSLEFGLDVNFLPIMQIEGRLQDAVFKMATEHINAQEKQEKIHNYISYVTDATMLLATQTASPHVAIAIAIEVMISYSVDRIVDEFLPNIEELTKIKDWYFINGLCVNARKTYIEQVNAIRTFKN